MENNCLNCNCVITENFCGNCGQKKYNRINKKYIVDELQYSLLHTNKGFLYSVKNILKNPGETARDFINGNRVNHYKPILLAFMLSGISAFISYKVIGLNTIMKEMYAEKQMYADTMNDFLSFAGSYNSFMMLLLIPIFAVFTITVFGKWGQNYYEHVVMNAYILSYYTITNIIIVYPLLYFFRHDLDVFIPITVLAILVIPFILVWFFKGFYKEKSLKSIILRILLLIGLLIIAYIVIIFAIVFLYLLPKGPEGLKQFSR